MKKIILSLSIFILVFLTLIFITRTNNEDIEIEFVDDFEKNQETILVCVQRNDGKLVLVKVDVEEKENIYLYVLKLYDHYRNSLPPTYISPLKGNFEVLNIYKNNEKLYIEVKTLYLYDNINPFLTALMWSYQQLGISSVEIKVNKQTFNLHKDDAINLVHEASSIYATNHQIVYYYQENEIIPVTYIHEEDPVDFLMKKVIAKEDYSKITYSYEIIENNLILEIFDNEFVLSIDIINNILNNLVNLGVFENIIIIKNEFVVANN